MNDDPLGRSNDELAPRTFDDYLYLLPGSRIDSSDLFSFGFALRNSSIPAILNPQHVCYSITSMSGDKQALAWDNEAVRRQYAPRRDLAQHDIYVIRVTALTCGSAYQGW